MSTRSGLKLDASALARAAVRSPVVFLAVAFVVLVLGGVGASRLKIRSNLVELLPSQSAAAQRFHAAVARAPGVGSTLTVLVQSPDADRNRATIDLLMTELTKLPSTLVRTVERGPGDLGEFERRFKWWFADVGDLERIACELEAAKARSLPGYVELENPCEDLGTEVLKSKMQAEPKTIEQVLDSLEAAEKEQKADYERFRGGYYQSPEGELFAVIVRAVEEGMGGEQQADLLRQVTEIAVGIESSRPGIRIGLAGDIANAVAEQKAVQDDLTQVTAITVGLVLLSIVLFFAYDGGLRTRSFWHRFVVRRGLASLWVIGSCMTTGCAIAFGVAGVVYGHLNAATTFLGSVIIGNGINYSIVYLARYYEQRSQLPSIEEALADASRTCLKATGLSALAAAGAYGALTATSFRGFAEFGLIGAVGMAACWAMTMVLCPALVVQAERQGLLGERVMLPDYPSVEPGRSGRSPRSGGRRWAAVGSLTGLVLVGVCAWPLVSYFRDPWEYNFSRLTSKTSKESGAGYWQNESNKVFVSRGGAQLVLASKPEEATALAQRLLEADKQHPPPALIQKVEVLQDSLGGEAKVLAERNELLGEIRGHLDWFLPKLKESDRAQVLEYRPPDGAVPPTFNDLPEPLKKKFTERDGTVGTQVYVSWAQGLSQSQGKSLLAMDALLAEGKLTDGTVAPNAARASIFAEMIRAMRRDGPLAVGLAMTVVFGVCAIGLRSLRNMGLVIASLLVGVIWMTGIIAWQGLKLNFLNFVALPLTFGIGAEYAINLVSRIDSEGGGFARGLKSVGGSVVLCSLTTVIGYGSLLLADSPALRSFGQYAILGEVCCLASSFLVVAAVSALRSPRA